MSKPTRRAFVMCVVASGTVVTAAQVAAQAAMVAENDPQASALGYKADTTKVDKVKYPNHAATQLCNNCQLYTGKATDAAGPCTLFPGKQVAGKGWCSAWVKKA